MYDFSHKSKRSHLCLQNVTFLSLYLGLGADFLEFVFEPTLAQRLLRIILFYIPFSRVRFNDVIDNRTIFFLKRDAAQRHFKCHHSVYFKLSDRNWGILLPCQLIYKLRAQIFNLLK